MEGGIHWGTYNLAAVSNTRYWGLRINYQYRCTWDPYEYFIESSY